MTDATQWVELAESWRALERSGADLDAVRRAVDRGTARLRRVRLVEWGVTLAVVPALALMLRSAPAGERVGWAVAALAHTAVVVGFAAWNRRGIWAPLGSTTAEYLALAVERCRRAVAAAWFVGAIVLVEVAALVWWGTAAGRLGSGRVAGLLLAGIVVGVGTAWFGRHKAAERDRLLALERAFARGTGVAA